ncbi:hypothetical protein T484DRAFT_1858619 [Baffinella frigidus]|nr:hypothetical protein T484DRAFT_1858619 [Cryptophyta sp. CCMP2293]
MLSRPVQAWRQVRAVASRPRSSNSVLSATLLLAALPLSGGFLLGAPALGTTLKGSAHVIRCPRADPFHVSSRRLRSGVVLLRAAAGGADPEPGPCPKCGDKNTYWDGMSSFACTACGEEWAVDGASDNVTEGSDEVKDVNGNVLSAGDTVVLVKDLAKGKLKKGLKVTKIRLGDFGDGHDVQANVPGEGVYSLKSEFLKKV